MKIWLLVGLAILPLATADARPQRVPKCTGLQVTVFGTSDSDVLLGTPQDDVIRSGPGADSIFSLSGNDAICSGRGSDRINGGPDHDRARGGKGVDVCQEVEKRRGCERVGM